MSDIKFWHETEGKRRQQLFKTYQREIVAFCNSQIGREMIAYMGAREALSCGPIVRVGLDTFVYFIKPLKNGQALFGYAAHPHGPYLQLLGDALINLDIAVRKGYTIDSKRRDLVLLHFMGWTRLLKHKLPDPLKEFNPRYLMAAFGVASALALPHFIFPLVALTAFGPINPDNPPGTTTMDEGLNRTVTNESWATITAGVGTSSSSTSPQRTPNIQPKVTSGYGGNNRGVFLFDTSTIGAGATVLTATQSHYENGAAGNDSAFNNTTINVYNATPASNTAATTSDYENGTGTTAFATAVTGPNWTANQYQDLVYTATGRSNVSVTGITKTSLKFVNDVSGTAPTPQGTSGDNNGPIINYSDQASNKPKLAGTFSAATPGGWLGNFM